MVNINVNEVLELFQLEFSGFSPLIRKIGLKLRCKPYPSLDYFEIDFLNFTENRPIVLNPSYLKQNTHHH